MKHLPIVVALVVGIIAFGVVISQPVFSQTTSVNAPPLAPSLMITDKVPILHPGQDIKPLFEEFKKIKFGGFAVQTSVGGPVIAIIKKEVNPAENPNQLDKDGTYIYVLKYDEDESFQWYDCGPAGHYHTTDIFMDALANDGIMNERNKFTAREFLDFYDCALDSGSEKYSSGVFDSEATEQRSLRDNFIVQAVLFNDAIKKHGLIAAPSIGDGIRISEIGDLTPQTIDTTNAKLHEVTMDDKYVGGIGSLDVTSKVVLNLKANTVSGEDPEYIIVSDKDGKQQYLIEFWRMSTQTVAGKQYLKIGMRLFSFSNNPEPLWSGYTTSEQQYEVSPAGIIVPTADENPQDQIALLEAASTPSILTFTYKSKTRGEVKISLRYTQKYVANVVSDITIDGISIDAGKDQALVGPQTLRIKLSDETIQKLIATNQFSGASNDLSIIYGKVTMKLTKVGQPDISIGPFDTVAIGTPFYPYFRVDDIKPDKYSLSVSIDGFKEIRGFEISARDLSSKNGAFVTESDILKINIPQFIADECNACKTLQACMVCTDDRLVQHYNK